MEMAKKILNLRKQQGLTQEQLADFIGVSKASVSKWETGQNFPDIVYLPTLASFFNVTIDELLGYEAKCPKEKVVVIYQELAKGFAEQSFEQTKEKFDEWLKRYYHDTNFVLKMAGLLLNHYVLAPTPEVQKENLLEVKTLCERVEKESNLVGEIKEAQHLHAFVMLALEQPEATVAILQDELQPVFAGSNLLIQAYQMLGKSDEAIVVGQVGLYQNVLNTANFLVQLLALSGDYIEKTNEIVARFEALVENFQMKNLHPNVVLQGYHTAASIYAAQKQAKETLVYLTNYVDVCTTKLLPISLHGDAFFDQISSWLENLNDGIPLPRDEQTVLQSLVPSITMPIFTDLLENDATYQGLIKILTNFVEEKTNASTL